MTEANERARQADDDASGWPVLGPDADAINTAVTDPLKALADGNIGGLVIRGEGHPMKRLLATLFAMTALAGADLVANPATFSATLEGKTIQTGAARFRISGTTDMLSASYLDFSGGDISTVSVTLRTPESGELPLSATGGDEVASIQFSAGDKTYQSKSGVIRIARRSHRKPRVLIADFEGTFIISNKDGREVGVKGQIHVAY